MKRAALLCLVWLCVPVGIAAQETEAQGTDTTPGVVARHVQPAESVIYDGYAAQMREWTLLILTAVIAFATWKTWRVYLQLAETAEKTNRISEMMTMETRLNRESEIAPRIVPVWDSAVTFHLTNEGRGRACDVRVTEPAEASRMTSIMLEPGQSDGGRGVAVSDAPNRRRLTITYSDVLGNRFETVSAGRSSITIRRLGPEMGD